MAIKNGLLSPAMSMYGEGGTTTKRKNQFEPEVPPYVPNAPKNSDIYDSSNSWNEEVKGMQSSGGFLSPSERKRKRLEELFGVSNPESPDYVEGGISGGEGGGEGGVEGDGTGGLGKPSNPYEGFLNSIYDSAMKNAEAQRFQSILDAQNAYRQYNPTYGSNAERYLAAGLRGSGLSDYGQASAYATMRGEIAGANAAYANAQLNADYAKAQNEYEIYQKLLSSAMSGNMTAEQIEALAGAYGITNKEALDQLKNTAGSAYSNGVYNGIEEAAKSGKYNAEDIEFYARQQGITDEEQIKRLQDEASKAYEHALYVSLRDAIQAGGSYTDEDIDAMAERLGITNPDYIESLKGYAKKGQKTAEYEQEKSKQKVEELQKSFFDQGLTSEDAERFAKANGIEKGSALYDEVMRWGEIADEVQDAINSSGNIEWSVSGVRRRGRKGDITINIGNQSFGASLSGEGVKDLDIIAALNEMATGDKNKTPNQGNKDKKDPFEAAFGSDDKANSRENAGLLQMYNGKLYLFTGDDGGEKRGWQEVGNADDVIKAWNEKVNMNKLPYYNKMSSSQKKSLLLDIFMNTNTNKEMNQIADQLKNYGISDDDIKSAIEDVQKRNNEITDQILNANQYKGEPVKNAIVSLKSDLNDPDYTDDEKARCKQNFVDAQGSDGMYALLSREQIQYIKDKLIHTSTDRYKDIYDEVFLAFSDAGYNFPESAKKDFMLRINTQMTETKVGEALLGYSQPSSEYKMSAEGDFINLDTIARKAQKGAVTGAFN